MRLIPILLGLALMPHATTASSQSEPVPTSTQTALLHGLARSHASMNKMAAALEQQGHEVCNIDYPSRKHTIETLAAHHVLPALQACFGDPLPRLNFVTHSLGGIILRQLRRMGEVPKIGRAVMLGPPNHGSEVVDTLGNWRAFHWLNGPAGQQLGSGADSLPLALGPADFPLGIIAGRFTINPLLSLMIPGPDDGKVSLQSARLEGMQDYLVVSVSHPFLMKNGKVIDQTLGFLQNGRFQH